jgi:hypothetical protein
VARKKGTEKQEAVSVAVNKSAAIREELSRRGGQAASGEIIKALAARGIVVSSAHVANEKARQLGKARSAVELAGGARPGRAGDLSSFEQTLLVAKQFVDRAGGIDEARKVLDLLARLRN